MSILIDPTKAAELATNGTSNNPIVLWESLTGTLSTTTGTEVESAALSATGTTYDAWVATPSGGTAALQMVFASAQSLNAVAIAAHNIGSISGARVQAQYSTDGGTTWLDAGSGNIFPTDNQAILFYFDEVSTTHWRIRVRDAGSNDVEIGVAYWGTVMTIPRRFYQGYTPPITPTNVMLQSNVSQGGNLLGAAVTRKGSSASATVQNVDPTFIRGTDFKGFMNHFNNGNGSFWAWRPTKYGDLFYCWRDGNTIAPTNSGPRDLMSFEMNMRFYDEP